MCVCVCVCVREKAREGKYCDVYVSSRVFRFVCVCVCVCVRVRVCVGVTMVRAAGRQSRFDDDVVVNSG